MKAKGVPMERHNFDRRRADVNLKALGQRVGVIETWLQDTNRKVDDAARKIDENTVITTQVQGKTSEMYDILQTIKGGLRFLGWVAVAAKWLAAIAAGVGVIIGAVAAANELAPRLQVKSWWGN